ncbi:lysosomal aspartic protease-like [Leptopilina heterotoma]|uniref:lysosomal aspartic protease-like n=1 Tax=Leptopilina heterotoma TaxID=63436 RepID=UPI001CA8561A|nr:lysosomal aspartic protease-like [Leptopilina heterotoma]
MFLRKSFLFFAILSTIASFIEASVLEIDIYKKYPSRLLQQLDNSLPQPPQNESVVLYKFMDSEYYGLIKIGQPAKEFKVIFDTTWSDTWVPSSRCDLIEIACMTHTRYDNTKSSTYQADGTVVNITGDTYSLLGFLSRDNFYLPHKNVTNQTFIEMTHMSFKTFAFMRADGIVGLGFQSLSETNSIPFFYNLVRQKVVKEPVFTVYMNRDETTDKAGRLILGGTERKHLKGDLTFTPVTKKQYWQIQIDSIMLESAKKTFKIIGKTAAIMSTSTNTIKGPRNEIMRINNLLNAKNIAPQIGRYVVDCREYARLPRIHFIIENKNFTIESKYYVQRMNFKSMEACLSPFVEEDGDFWQLGGAFLMQFYTEYYFDGRIAIGQTVF